VVELDLLQNLERRSQRLRKNRLFVSHAVGHEMQIVSGNRHQFRAAAIGSEDSHHRSVRAVPAKAAIAELALAARKVDLSDDASARQFLRSVVDFANELVAGNSAEAHVPSEDLEIGGANAGEANADNSSAGAHFRFRMPRIDLKILAVPY
jgi:hypothetical protein